MVRKREEIILQTYADITGSRILFVRLYFSYLKSYFEVFAALQCLNLTQAQAHPNEYHHHGQCAFLLFYWTRRFSADDVSKKCASCLRFGCVQKSVGEEDVQAKFFFQLNINTCWRAEMISKIECSVLFLYIVTAFGL